MTQYLKPDWPAPVQIKACTTLRQQGYSQGVYQSWNLATHVNDSLEHVEKNRQLLSDTLALPAEPVWLEQVHSDQVVLLEENIPAKNVQADGSYTRVEDKICVVMTADCLPVLITNRAGTEVAAVHAGWRGLAAGIVEKAVQCFQSEAKDCLVWLGPAIGPAAFEVGDDVRQAFMQQDAETTEAFVPTGEGKYLANIYALARQRLQLAGVTDIYGGDHCTYTEAEQFYSYRRDQETGRMASLIWIDSGSKGND